MEEMRYAAIEKNEIVNGNGIGVSLYIQGCPIRCKGCFNPETWDFNGGNEWWADKTTLEIYNLLNKDYINRLSILGGEPLYIDNLFYILLLLIEMKEACPDKEFWLWTGYTWEQLQERIKKAQDIWPKYTEDIYLQEILNQLDYLIAGPFVQEEKDLTLIWRGSRNQEVIDMNKTREEKKKVLYVRKDF